MEVNVSLQSTEVSMIAIPVILTTNGRYQSSYLPSRCKIY